MPCFTDNCPPSREQVLDAKAPAMLCAFLTAMSDQEIASVFGRIYWREAGVTVQEFADWRALHLAKDQARRLREVDRLERKRLADEARAALTPEQLAALKAEGF